MPTSHQASPYNPQQTVSTPKVSNHSSPTARKPPPLNPSLSMNSTAITSKKDCQTNQWANLTTSSQQNKDFFTSAPNGAPNGPTHVMSMTNYFNRTEMGGSGQQDMAETTEEGQFGAGQKMGSLLPGNNTVSGDGRSE